MKGDCNTFKQLICFIKSIIRNVYIIERDNLLSILTMIDLARSTHGIMRDCNTDITTHGTCVIDQKLSMQKMNIRSLRKTEYVGVSECLPNPIYFELSMSAGIEKCKLIILNL